MDNEPSLENLLDQYEDIGGPELYGPEGTAILIAVWRKSKKLGWKDSFQMTNTELQFQTGIKSRETINNHRAKLAAAELIEYTAPARGQSRGDYTIRFNLPGIEKPVQKMDNFTYNKPKVVREMDHSTDTVLKDLKSTTTSNTTGPNPLISLIDAYCTLHNKLEFHLVDKERRLMMKMIGQGIPSAVIIRVMHQVHAERSKETRITSFLYYEGPIYEAWKTEQAITEGVPISPVAIGAHPITDRVPAPPVAIGKPSYLERRNEIAKRKIREAEERDRSGSQEIVLRHNQHI